MSRPVYRFGDYRLDPSARELHHRDELAVLSPKVFDCLAYLIEHRDRAVGRDELIAAVWGKLDVSETLLGQTVLKARRAVGDTGNEQNAIRTVPRFGYRWVAELLVEEPAPATADPLPGAPDAGELGAEPSTASAPAAHDAGSATAPTAAHGRYRIAAIGVMLAILVAVALGAWRGSQPDAAPAAAQGAGTASGHASGPASTAANETAAVLPVDVVEAGDTSWLRLGLMDLIATRLRSAGQAVVPSDNVVALTQGASSGDAASARLVSVGTGAQFLITPSARQNGARWTVRLAVDSAQASRREVEAVDADPLDAGRAATDRLLALLGKRAPSGSEGMRSGSAAELLARAEAMLLTDDLASARRLLESAPPSLQQSPELRLRLAQIDFRAGELDSARVRLGKLLGEVGAEADPVLRARILNGYGVVELRTDHYAEGERRFTEAIALLENRSQPAALGQAYTGRAVGHAAQGHYEAATADFSRARVALELAGDRLALARVEVNEGIVASKRGHFAEALVAQQRAAQRFERFGALNELVGTLGNVAVDQLALLQPIDALATTDRAWPTMGRLENRRTQHALKIERATALAANGRLVEARALLAELASGSAADGDDALLARVHLEQARVDAETGHFDTAAALAADAVARFDSDDYQRERAMAWLYLARTLRAQGRDADAAGEVARLRDWSKSIDAPPARLYAMLADAERLWGQDQAAAHPAYRATLELAAHDGVPFDIAEVVVSYGTRLIAAGELERASSVVGQAARWAESDYACALLQVRHYRALGERDAWAAAAQRARGLAGERTIPPALLEAPDPPSNPKTARILSSSRRDPPIAAAGKESTGVPSLSRETNAMRTERECATQRDPRHCRRASGHVAARA